jgi:hypothetical protein
LNDRAGEPASAGVYRVVQIRPEGYPHAEALTELAEATYYGLRRLGLLASPRDAAAPPARQVLFGAHLLNAETAAAAAIDAIIYNSEQIYDGSPWLRQGWYLEMLGTHEVWDYSADNVARLKEIGVTRVRHVPLGYVPELVRIAPAAEDIDVLFYGSTAPRRQAVIEALQARGLKVVTLFGVYGEARDRVIARAKVVLNLHRHAAKIFEIVRVAYLLSNFKAVVAECGADTAVDTDLRPGFCGVPYEQLVEACVDYVQNEGARKALASRGYEVFAARPAERLLGEALQLRRTPDPYGRKESAPGDLCATVRSISWGARRGADERSLRLSANDTTAADAVVDLADTGLIGTRLETLRWNTVILAADSFDAIHADGELAATADLHAAMTNCLRLLRPGGLLHVAVPYGSGAGTAAPHANQFDEHSWHRFADEHWRSGWIDMRFDVVFLQAEPSGFGQALLAEGHPQAEILATPGAVERLHVVLRKRYTQDSERRAAAAAVASMAAAGNPAALRRHMIS